MRESTEGRMVLPLLSLMCVMAAGSLLPGREPAERVYYELERAEEHFEAFVRKYGRRYADQREKDARFRIFRDNLRMFNRKNDESEHAVFGVDNFADMSAEEFARHVSCLRGPAAGAEAACAVYEPAVGNYTAPESFDWRDEGAVTPVRTQGSCGACWAFSAIGSVEAQYALRHGAQVDLSEQQLLDCDRTARGCEGGDMQLAFRYMVDAGGVEGEDEYPYEERQGSCRFREEQARVRVGECFTHAGLAEDDLKEFLYRFGPLSIGVDARSFHGYSKGVYSCTFEKINHGVLLVGYGAENDVPYWTIKNSWGEDFGEDGYIRIKRGVNACGIMNYPATYAEIESSDFRRSLSGTPYLKKQSESLD